MKVNEYKLMEEVVERGISSGWNRAYKHTDSPKEEDLKEQIRYYVMLEICEYFTFNNNNNDKNEN